MDYVKYFRVLRLRMKETAELAMHSWGSAIWISGTAVIEARRPPGMLHTWFGQDCSLTSQLLGTFSRERLGAIEIQRYYDTPRDVRSVIIPSDLNSSQPLSRKGTRESVCEVERFVTVLVRTTCATCHIRTGVAQLSGASRSRQASRVPC